MKRSLALGIGVAAAVLAPRARAEDVVPADRAPQQQQVDAAASSVSQELVVTGQRLNAARESIQPSLGATVETITNAAIQALPGGDNQQLNQIILQLPGVVQDGFGQLHIRDDHNGIQYRLNGVILPEGISVFGQTLSPRLIGKLDLITGAMPAQYGLRTAGVLNLTTKDGLFTNGGQVSIYGGSHGTYEPSFEYGGSSGATNYFFSGDYRRDQLGIESVDGSSNPAHDRTDQLQLFSYVDHILDPDDRVTLIAGYSNQRFQIPNPRGLEPDGTYSLEGQTTYPSEDLNERQRESTAYAIASLQHTTERLTLQTSLFSRYSTLTYLPDVTGELLFNGIAQAAAKRDFAVGIQGEGVYDLSDAHTLRGGVIVQGDLSTSDTATHVFPADAEGNPTSNVPIVIGERGGKTAWTYSAYVQDEWKIARAVTVNFGLRFDDYNAYRSEDQLSPRVNLVWQPGGGFTLHAGYARYFTPPPFELVANTTVSKFAGTTGQAPGTGDTTPYAERQNYFDVGVQQKLGGLTLGLDSYYRKSKNLIDEGQFGAPIILTPFNYADGKIYGVELSADYVRGPLNLYANFAAERAQGRDILSSQFNFDLADLAYIANHFIYLDHDQTYTASAGASYRFAEGTLLSADLIYGSGLRTDGAVPNGDALGDYIQVNASVSQKLDLPRLGRLEVRLDVINAFDRVYEIRDGSGVGVGAPEYGPRRGVFIGLTKSF